MSPYRTIVRGLLAILVVCGAVAVSATGASAFTVRGKVVNGTTGAPVDVKIYAVSPASGMDEEQQVQTQGGAFEFTDLSDQAPLYLLRVTYKGVEYNDPVQVTGQDQTVTVTVYETTSSWDGVHITMPHLAAVREHDHLMIEQLFEISNDTEPKRSIGGKDGFFRIYLPAEVDTIASCFVTALNVPVDRDPQPTGVPNEYYIDYPIRPGVTRIGIAYKVPYPDEFTLAQKMFYDISHISVFAVDPAMKVTSSTHELAEQEAVHGMSAWSVHGITAGSTLSLRFEGGQEHAPAMAGMDGEDGGGDTGQVHAAPSQSQTFSIYLMITLGLVLLTLAAVVARDNNDPLSDTKVLRGHYDLLATRLARLDDLRATGAITADAHRAARESLMTRLALIALQLRSHGGKRKDEPKPEAAPHAVKHTQAS
ncbi:MAG TPA: hypothetical protein VFX92_06780 [Candidatus Krumholzibacteria bacterium]|nr:hypothetical protein [Candidatus Krumholzibacteria bacterium]